MFEGAVRLTPVLGKMRQAWPALISGSWGSSSTRKLLLEYLGTWYLQVFTRYYEIVFFLIRNKKQLLRIQVPTVLHNYAQSLQS